jgi:gliding motility-associatede transport system auxiliary component
MASLSPSSRRRMIESSTLGAGALLALVLLGIVNYFAWKYHARFDWTKSHIYTLSEKSQKVLGSLDKEIQAVVFMTPSDELYDPVRELLSRYEAASPRITVRTIDPEKNPAEAQSLVDKYQISKLNVVVFDSGDDRRVVEGTDLADYDYSGYQYGQGPKMTGFKGEQAFTGAIVELAEAHKPSIRFTTGHGELKVDDFSSGGLSQARDLLGKDNFEINSWASLGQPQVPAGTDLVVIAGPTLRFTEPEVAALRSYLKGGGRLLALLDPQISQGGELSETGLEGLLSDYGLEVGNDLVIDPANPLPFYGAETIFVEDYGDHPITRALRQTQVPVIFPLARSVRRSGDVAGLEVVDLLKTSDEGWGETDLSDLRHVAKGDGDLAGPVPLGVAVEESAKPADKAQGSDDAEPAEGSGAAADSIATAAQPAADAEAGDAEAGQAAGATAAKPAAKGTRLVVLGDSTFATNGQLMNVGNSVLLANVMNWLVERQNLLAIPPKSPEQVRLSLTSAQLHGLTWIVLALLPGLALVGGVVVYVRRRR